MKLHEAIIKVLLENGVPMTTTAIAARLNQTKWYVKKDSSIITGFQIAGRTKNYPELFNRNGSTVSLKKTASSSSFPGANDNTAKPLKRVESGPINQELVEKMLMNEKNFQTVPAAERRIPGESGLYCIRLRSDAKLPATFQNYLKERQHNIIYFGIATTSLMSRFFNQELRAKGHGTFFRSIGAMLGYTPVPGSLIDKANKRNYKFSISDEAKIINWIDQHLLINWVSLSGDLEQIETYLILKYKPLLNIAKNPMALKELSALRAECVRIANCI